MTSRAIFLTLTLANFLWSSSIYASPLCSKGLENFRPYSQNESLFENINKKIETFIKDNEPAQDIEQLQSQITELLDRSLINQISMVNQKLNQQAQKYYKTLETQTPSWATNPQYNLKNFALVSQGVYRFRFPTMEAITKAHNDHFISNVITLNHEGMLYYWDPAPHSPITESTRLDMKNKMLQAGYSKDETELAIHTYEKHRDYFISSIESTNKWHQAVPFNHPEQSIEEIFIVLDRVLNARKSGQTVGIHCMAGKHRTGIIAMLIEIADLETITTDKLQQIYDNYFLHTWWARPGSRYQYPAMIPLIIKSTPFKSFRKKWHELAPSRIEYK